MLRKHKSIKESRQLRSRLERQDGGDVLIWPDDDDTAGFAIDVSFIEYV